MRFRPRPAILLALLILVGSMYFFLGVFIPGLHPGLVARNLGGGFHFGNDFYPIWVAGGELRHHRDPYAPSLTPRIETGLYGRPLDRSVRADAQVNYRAFSYPVFTIFVFAPLLPMSFPAVQVMLAILLPCAAGLTVLLWLRVLGTDLSAQGIAVAMCLALASYPVLEGIYAGQPGLISAAFIAGALAALGAERYLLAGVLLPWAAMKPQLVLLLVIWLVFWCVCNWNRRRTFVFGLGVSGSVMLGLSTWAAPHWIDGWMHALHEYRQISPAPLAQFVLGSFAGWIVSAILVGLSLLVCWRARCESAASPAFALATTLLLATTVLTLPSTIAIYDQFLLLPGALWLYTNRSLILRGSLVFRILTLITMAAVAWQWFWSIALVLIHWMGPWLPRGPAILLLPFRTAASTPFAITAMLCFVAFQKIRTQPGNAASPTPQAS
ncbi:MAG TPA: glycosyltransferase 87 family protein [Terriglobales bacterium]|nr:glycosyltransferase 87 family protein [Terriglobales bacterium]